MSEVMALVDDCVTGGYSDRWALFSLIAVYGLDWNAQIFRNQWSARALAVVAYLDGVDAAADDEQKAFDVCRDLEKLAHWWRRSEPTGEFWSSCIALEARLASAARRLWPRPVDVGPLQRSCDILACVMKTRHAVATLLEGELATCAPAPRGLLDWLAQQIEIGKQAASERNPEVERLYMSAELFPGEEDGHARAANGVFAPNGLDVAETQRPNVAFDALATRIADFDTEGACGVLYFHVVARQVRKNCKFDWVRNNLFIDFQLSSERQVMLPLRRNPWILLVGNTYCVRHPRGNTTYYSQDSREAIDTWFRLFWGDGEKEFFDGEDFYSMLSLPSSCPLRRAAYIDVDDDDEDNDEFLG